MKNKLTVRIVLALGIIVFGVLTILGFKIYFNVQNNTSSQRGVEWLIKQQGKTDPVNHKSGYRLMYKVTPDGSTARNLSEIIKKSEGLREAQVINNTDSRYDDWTLIGEDALNLQLEQCSGKDISADAGKLKNIFLSHRDEIKAAIPLDPTDVINTLYFLGKVGISDEILRTEAVESLRTAGGNSIQSIYGLTHIIFTDSDFLDRYLNPANFQTEIGIFNRILAKYAPAEKISSSDADWLSEVIISLKLLGQDNNINSMIMKSKLISMQNKDGSWGSGTMYEEQRHVTVVASLSLMDFTKNPRVTNGFCPPK